MLSPVDSQPAQVAQLGLDVRRFLRTRIGVVEAQMEDAALELLGDAEVEVDGLGVADVQESVRLGWEPGDDAAVVLVRLQISPNRAANEVVGARRLVRGHGNPL